MAAAARALFGSAAAASAVLQPAGLKTNGLSEPLGVGDATLTNLQRTRGDATGETWRPRFNCFAMRYPLYGGTRTMRDRFDAMKTHMDFLERRRATDDTTLHRYTAAGNGATQAAQASAGHVGLGPVVRSLLEGGSSRNHVILLQIEEWLHTGIAGIKQAPGSVACGDLIIKPTPGRRRDARQGALVPAKSAAQTFVATGSGDARHRRCEDGYQGYDAAPGDVTFVQGTSAVGSVGGHVPATPSLSLGAPATFAFTPGVAKVCFASTNATVISTAGDATLNVADPSAANTGELVDGAFALPQAVQARPNDGAYAAVRGSSTPTPLLTCSGLRTGAYAKTLTFTLSTTTP